jgi:hypothetical protein
VGNQRETTGKLPKNNPFLSHLEGISISLCGARIFFEKRHSQAGNQRKITEKSAGNQREITEIYYANMSNSNYIQYVISYLKCDFFPDLALICRQTKDTMAWR